MTQVKDWIACNQHDVLAIVQISKRLSNEILQRKTTSPSSRPLYWQPENIQVGRILKIHFNLTARTTEKNLCTCTRKKTDEDSFVKQTTPINGN